MKRKDESFDILSCQTQLIIEFDAPPYIKCNKEIESISLGCAMLGEQNGKEENLLYIMLLGTVGQCNMHTKTYTSQ